jgi:hypothetical protein
MCQIGGHYSVAWCLGLLALGRQISNRSKAAPMRMAQSLLYVS